MAERPDAGRCRDCIGIVLWLIALANETSRERERERVCVCVIRQKMDVPSRFSVDAIFDLASVFWLETKLSKARVDESSERWADERAEEMCRPVECVNHRLSSIGRTQNMAPEVNERDRVCVLRVMVMRRSNTTTKKAKKRKKKKERKKTQCQCGKWQTIEEWDWKQL